MPTAEARCQAVARGWPSTNSSHPSGAVEATEIFTVRSRGAGSLTAGHALAHQVGDSQPHFVGTVFRGAQVVAAIQVLVVQADVAGATEIPAHAQGRSHVGEGAAQCFVVLARIV